MALVGTRVQTVQDGENTVAVKTDVVVDTETGLVLERKTVLAEVLTESGNHKAVVAGQQTRVSAIQPPTYGSARPAIQEPPRSRGYQAQPHYASDNDENKWAVHLLCCLLTVICPCWVFVWLCYCCISADD